MSAEHDYDTLKLHRRVLHEMATPWAGDGFTATRLMILQFVNAQGGEVPAITDVERSIGVDRSTAHSIVCALGKMHWLKVRANRKDRRQCSVRLTDVGRDNLARGETLFRANMADVWSRLDGVNSHEAAEYRRLLEKLAGRRFGND